jgi:hypothetical protein
MGSLVKLQFSILHLFQKVLSLAKMRATIRVMRYSEGEWSVRFSGRSSKGRGDASASATVISIEKKLKCSDQVTFSRLFRVLGKLLWMSRDTKVSISESKPSSGHGNIFQNWREICTIFTSLTVIRELSYQKFMKFAILIGWIVEDNELTSSLLIRPIRVAHIWLSFYIYTVESGIMCYLLASREKSFPLVFHSEQRETGIE